MSGYEVEILSDANGDVSVERRLQEAAISTLRSEQAPPQTALTIWLTDDEQLKRLNAQFRDEDKPTDVLSFPSGETRDQQRTYLGDIAISVPMAGRQAAASGHDLDAELTLLTIHGVLHLLGYDHAEPGEKAAMWSLQTTVLRQLGLDAEQILAKLNTDTDAH